MSDPIGRLADALSPRFRIERQLDHGGAAHIYLAEDRLHGRRVAVKVLRDELAATVSADRFGAEIRLSSHLQHPSIVPVLESGDVGGVPYYVMPFIEGQSLRARLACVERLSLADALWITEDLARALDFAHRRCVVHRDIKPANVMLHRGRALLLDFGIALACDGIDPERRTSPGMTLGTVEYMSPEQAAADPHIDGRSDIYSLACVTYELLAGRPPFVGAPLSVMTRHMTVEPNALGAMCPGMPAELSHVLARALAKSPADRFATATEFLAALRNAAGEASPRPSEVAVLPLLHVRPPGMADFFADRLTERVIFALRKEAGVQVSARNAPPAGNCNVHMRDIGRHLDSRALLLGNVRETVGCVQLSAVLVDAPSGRQLTSISLMGRRRDQHDAEGELAEGLARAVRPALDNLVRHPPGECNRRRRA